MENGALKGDGRLLYNLMSLYESYGYKKYKMSKFEDYELYVENKNFIPNENIITFRDASGRLLALKPDLTLSIGKNASFAPGLCDKLYYSENVYRVTGEPRELREIPQVGLELIGCVDAYSVCEVVSLALDSLALFGGEYLLEISHMGFVSGIMEGLCLSPSQADEVGALLSCKNAHGISAFCAKNNLPQEVLTGLAALSGEFEPTLVRAKALFSSPKTNTALAELEGLYRVLSLSGRGNVILDFSAVNDLSYYNGIIFRGYVKGVPSAVLSGGRYDSLLRKLGKEGGAIGFAVYPDLLEYRGAPKTAPDADVLILYDDSTPPEAVTKKARELIRSGRSVRASQAIDGISYLSLEDLRKEGQSK